MVSRIDKRFNHIDSDHQVRKHVQYSQSLKHPLVSCLCSAQLILGRAGYNFRMCVFWRPFRRVGSLIESYGLLAWIPTRQRAYRWSESGELRSSATNSCYTQYPGYIAALGHAIDVQFRPGRGVMGRTSTSISQ